MLLRTSPRSGLQPPVTRGHAILACSPVRERVHCPARGRKAGRALRTQAFLLWPGSRVSAKSIITTMTTYVTTEEVCLACVDTSLYMNSSRPNPVFHAAEKPGTQEPVRNHVSWC